MLRNNELRKLIVQLNKSSRTSLLSEEERKAAEGLTDSSPKATPKEDKGRERKKK